MRACTSLYYDPGCSSFRILPVDGHRRKSMWAICQDTRSVAHDDKHFQVSEEIPNFVLYSSISISGEKLTNYMHIILENFRKTLKQIFTDLQNVCKKKQYILYVTESSLVYNFTGGSETEQRSQTFLPRTHTHSYP